MFSSWVGITMGMIHGGNSASYWLGSCLHLGRMWPHNTLLSGPSLSDFEQPLLEEASVRGCKPRTRECSRKARKDRLVWGGRKNKKNLANTRLLPPVPLLSLSLPPSSNSKTMCSEEGNLKQWTWAWTTVTTTETRPDCAGGSCRCDAGLMFP